jgi:hypothetical protein
MPTRSAQSYRLLGLAEQSHLVKQRDGGRRTLNLKDRHFRGVQPVESNLFRLTPVRSDLRNMFRGGCLGQAYWHLTHASGQTAVM